MAYSIHALKKGKVLHSKYEIDTILGEGGFGITYKALDQGLNRWVAIKEYLPTDHGAVRNADGTNVSLSSEQKRDVFDWGLKSFRQEAQTLANIKHDNIIKVLDYFEENGTGYFVMRYEEGETLGKLIKRKKEFNEKEIRQILEPLIDGLQEVHKHNILHQDITPDNIYIRSNGKPMLIDFGAAREAMTIVSSAFPSFPLSSSPYAPAEQYADRSKQGAWTDIYALGMVAYWLITGEDSGQIPTSSDRQNALLDNESDPLPKLKSSAYKDSYSSELLESIDKALAVRSKDRFQSVEEWQEVLKKENKVKISKTVQPDDKSNKKLWIGSITTIMVILIGGFLLVQDGLKQVVRKLDSIEETTKDLVQLKDNLRQATQNLATSRENNKQLQAQLAKTSSSTSKPKIEVNCPNSSSKAINMGIRTGGAKGTYIKIGKNIADLVNDCHIMLNVLTSKGSIQNVNAVHKEKGIQMGIVQDDVLSYFQEQAKKIVKIKRLHKS